MTWQKVCKCDNCTKTTTEINATGWTVIALDQQTNRISVGSMFDDVLGAVENKWHCCSIECTMEVVRSRILDVIRGAGKRRQNAGNGNTGKVLQLTPYNG